MANLIYISDKDYIAAIKDNDDRKIANLYKLAYPPISRFICSNNGTIHDAKDIYQEAFIIAMRQIRQSKFLNKSSIATYIFSIARKLWLKQLTKRGIKQLNIMEVEEFISIETDSFDFTEYENKLSTMQESLEKLGEPCSTILRDFYLQKLSMNEIMEKMGYTSTDNAKNQKYKCLQRLKKTFFSSYQKVKGE